ncbi:prephenate dehydratase [Silvibacterium dinghuense]|uniref:Prephenate dehydratase n=1 Tax=Silvibacterium dinghuense TaxID=1560006 RepID=A0A4Q1SDY9_9BACT|nr:prephenate dehydratase [Silvibacterium dinghuense]RXS95333.1 prephenate dehydratase [Silvibacterium dinghuense]GGH12462.1 prephenate dehydratase [Silvibacterium dinghuense]
MRVAIQGEPGSFSHEAAVRMVPECIVVHCAFSAEVFGALADGRVDAAVIPIENALAGSVLEHYDLLLQHEVLVEREYLLPIHHNLIVVPGTTIADIRSVYSHPIALAQCRRFFARHPQITARASYDTAGSVKQLMAQEDRTGAAIAGAGAATHYGAEILERNLEDSAQNYTRFFLVKRKAEAVLSPAADKVSVAFEVQNRPGSLVAALQSLAGLGVNLTKIESRPVPGSPWHYIFYTDYQLSSPEMAEQALALLAGHCSMVRELGRYVTAYPEAE